MDYQIVPKTQNQHFMFVINLLIIFTLPCYFCIVNRDIVLTPKQGLQLSGKRIFYDEESSSSDNIAVHHNDSVVEIGVRPWERTLKHVTYLTLFTNAVNGIITGNFSKVKEYNDFLASPYVHSPEPIDSRFGDIVTLAQGRLETMPNGSYRFKEGNCDYECARESNIIAMWHVQKIRHRDTADRKYHYEMKFSVSPMNAQSHTETVVRGGPNKRTIMEESKSNVQTFIQKEDDYPHSFRKIVSDKDEDFLDKRYDSGRSFRHAKPHQTQQVTPIPQSTFLRGVFHYPPSGSMSLQHSNGPQRHSLRAHSRTRQNQHQHQHQQPLINLPERLNTGEFYKGNNYVPKSSSKIELFPNLLNMFLGNPLHSLPPPAITTFRPPTYPMKFARPEVYTLQQHQLQELAKFAEYQQLPLAQSQEQFNHRTPSSVPIVTHHYHHHFFMPNNTAITIEQAIQHSGEQSQDGPAEVYHNQVTEVAAPQGYVPNLYEEPQSKTKFRQQHFPLPAQHQAAIQQQHLHPNYYSNYRIQQIMPPAPQKYVFTNAQIEPQRVVHVTPTPPLKKPHFMQQYQQQVQLQQYDNRPFTSSLEYTTVHVPLLITYPASINEEKREEVSPPGNKPFVQSDPIDDVHYSEPDPLYANLNANEEELSKDKRFLSNGEYQEPQLESPDHYDQTNNNQQQITEEADNKKEHSESIEAQLPPPNSDTQATETIKATKNIKQNLSEYKDTKRPVISALRNKRINLKTGTTTSSTTTTHKPTTSAPLSPAKSSTTTNLRSSNSKSKKTFVSNSSTESPLRTISRYRNSYARTSSTSTTTTEKPVLKWTPKRQNSHSKLTTSTSSAPPNIDREEDGLDETDKSEDSDENEEIKTNESNNFRISKSSLLPEVPEDFTLQTTTEILNAITADISSTTSTTSAPTLAALTPSTFLSKMFPTAAEIYEILTQKSVSKSVSLKVGNNGEEIPVIVDDEENEVKTV